MNTADFRISLDVHDSHAQAAMKVKKGDTARKIHISLTENGKPYQITPDCSAVFTARKPDGTLLYNACVIQGSTIVYALTPQTTAAAGEVCCELRVYGSDAALLTSPRFLLLVDETVYTDGDVVEASNEFSELTRLIGQTTALKEELEDILASGERQGAPLARAYSTDGISYNATGEDLPEVMAGSEGGHAGKGKQIVFVPDLQNATNAPTLAINDGAAIPIRLRAPRNQGEYDNTPAATLPVPFGALMRGVPYTMTFCGLYWLVDSQIAQFDPHQAEMMRNFADKAMGLSDGDTIGVPVINSMDGIAGEVAFGFIRRSQAEYASPPEDGSVTLPTEGRVDELIRKGVTEQYAARTAEAYTRTERISGGLLRVYFSNDPQRPMKAPSLQLMHCSRRRGTRYKWRHPANFDVGSGSPAARWGYAQLAETSYENKKEAGVPLYPPVPDWMRNGGWMQTEIPLTAEDIARGYKELDPKTYFLPLIKPTLSGNELSWDSPGIVGLSVGSRGRASATHLLRFDLADNGVIVGRGRNEILFGGKKLNNRVALMPDRSTILRSTIHISIR